jgi:hypothetical protein
MLFAKHSKLCRLLDDSMNRFFQNPIQHLHLFQQLHAQASIGFSGQASRVLR